MKNAVVTGHMSGMGKGAYELLKQKGYNVIGWDLQGEGDEKVDVRSAKEVAEAAARLTEPVDAVVLSAGVWKEMPLLETTDEDWSYLMDTNAYGIFNCVRALVPHMHRDTAIAAISSASGMRGVPFEAAYSASKFAVCGFAEAAARELGPRGIRINVVCPFYVRTPMTDAALIEKEELTGITVEESYKMEGDQVPLGRVAEPEDIAELLYFLVSDASRYVTGAIIPISGGTHCGYGPVLSSYDEKDVE